MHCGTPVAEQVEAVTFASEIGWMAAVWTGRSLARLTIGYGSESAARHSIADDVTFLARPRSDMVTLIERLQCYADGHRVDFSEIIVQDWTRTRFQQAVLRACRAIPYGCSVPYGQLARQAGYPGAARAVGNVMASNRTPLVIPCHRVVGAAGALGGFSAPEGKSLKRRLLALEGLRVG